MRYGASERKRILSLTDQASYTMARYILSASVLLSLTLSAQSWTVQPRFQQHISSRRTLSAFAVSGEAASVSPSTETGEDENCLTQTLISKLRFRELQSHLAQRDLSTEGTTGQLRDRLREAVGLDTECVVNEDGMGDDCIDVSKALNLSDRLFDLQIDPPFDFVGM